MLRRGRSQRRPDDRICLSPALLLHAALACLDRAVPHATISPMVGLTSRLFGVLALPISGRGPVTVGFMKATGMIGTANGDVRAALTTGDAGGEQAAAPGAASRPQPAGSGPGWCRPQLRAGNESTMTAARRSVCRGHQVPQDRRWVKD